VKILLLAIAVTCTAIAASGQVSIKGKISDGRQPLPSVTVLLLSLDSTWIKSTVTDDNGEFTILDVISGDYLLSVSMIGYDKYFSPAFTASERSITFPEIILLEATTELDEVIVKTQKQLFDQQIDRLVVNVESSITSTGNTVLEVLQKSPGIVVNRQNGVISMNGKAGVLIMVDNKMQRLPMSVVVEMLDGMNAAGVEKIELITTPPAKYDAEGNAGIIHIVTKGKEDAGTNVSVGLVAGAKWAETFGGNAVVNHRGKHIAYVVDYSILQTHNLHTVKMDRTMNLDAQVQTVHDDSRRENLTTQQNISTGLEWKMSKHTSLNFLLTGFSRSWDLNAHATDVYHVRPDSTVVTSMNVHESNIWRSGTGSFGFQSEINSKSSINVNLDYLLFHNNNPSQYDVEESHEQSSPAKTSKVDLEKSTPIRVLIMKTDYQRQVSSLFSWEAGLKAVSSTLSNNVLVQRMIDGDWNIDPVFTSYSDLREQIYAAYLSTKWHADKKWQVNSGLRYEYTRTTISTPAVANIVDRKYGYLFPSVVIRKQIDAERDFLFSYSRRITRPTYNDIAPFVFFWSPNTFSAGNTSLYPAVADAISGSYHRNQWILSMHFTHSKNDIAFLQPEADSQPGNLTYRSQNMEYMNTLGVTNSYSMAITRWCEIQSNITAQRQVAKTSHLPDNTRLHLYGVNINLICQITLPKDFSIEISGMYQSRTLAGISQYLPLGSLNAGIQKTLGENGTLKLAIDDILNSNNWRIETRSFANNLDTYFNYNWHNRYIRLTYTWKLGNNKLRMVKMKSGSEEERNRVN
jgi:hypothetical protein